jgi:hypothetical protein
MGIKIIFLMVLTKITEKESPKPLNFKTVPVNFRWTFNKSIKMIHISVYVLKLLEMFSN